MGKIKIIPLSSDIKEFKFERPTLELQIKEIVVSNLDKEEDKVDFCFGFVDLYGNGFHAVINGNELLASFNKIRKETECLEEI